MSEKAVAQFFADLASVRNLSALEQWRKVKLCEDMDKAGLLQSPLSSSQYRSKEKRLMNSWGRGARKIPAAWLSIQDVHPHVFKLINALVDTGKVDVHKFHKEMIRPVEWQIENGRVASIYNPFQMAQKELWVPFVRTVLSDLFPFRRCNLCKMIFVPASKKQKKFCSRECAVKAVALTPRRKQYMRDYMRERKSP